MPCFSSANRLPRRSIAFACPSQLSSSPIPQLALPAPIYPTAMWSIIRGGKIGTGKTTYLRAREALHHWKQLDLGWISSSPPLAPIEADQTVSVLARVCGLWSLNACRIVYVTRQENPWPCFGYAYGTLPDHAESGEERFLVEWTPADDVVYYDILAFSRPQSALARLGFPLARRFQKRFARDSLQAMRRAVTRSTY